MSVSQARKKANEKWNNNNREHRNYLTKRSNARGFIRNHATLEDLEELRKLIDKREKELEQEDKDL